MEEALGILERRLSEDENLSKRTNLSVSELMLLIQECVQSPYFECELGLDKKMVLQWEVL